jgi:SH3-like domain-containing protein
MSRSNNSSLGMMRSLPVFVCLFVLGASAALAQGTNEGGTTGALGPSTSLPLPRFVSLKKDVVYMRRGPGSDHPIEWQYVRKHLPVEVINEYDLWREVRDPDGKTEGWISANMLSGERYVMVIAPKGSKTLREPLRNRPDARAKVVALAEPGVIAELKHCPDDWCEISAEGRTGWIKRSAVWGILPDERVE